MSRFLELGLTAILLASPALADGYGLGRPATPAEIAAWDIDVRPDGLGLPPGQGSVLEGEEVFADRCAVCHGDFGEAVGRWPVLAGGQGTLTDERPVKTIGSYWPYLSTVWDYVHRAMPFGDAQSLSDDEVYAITAYLLYVNDVVDDEDFVLSRDNFLEIPMENADGFFPDDRPETELATFRDACMSNCKDSVTITRRAAVIDVTPEETKANALKAAVDQVRQAAVEEAVSDPDLVAAGEKVFRKCKACHKIGADGKNATGPRLWQVVGHPAGAVDGFKYSKPLMAAAEGGLVWDEASLSAFLAKPRAFLKGTKMSFAGLRKEEDIAAIIAYLDTLDD